MESIVYKGGYKYQLRKDYTVKTGIIPKEPVDTGFIALTLEGHLTVRTGYAWDGPSGPTIDTQSFMRGALVHDALYQLMREEKLNKGKDREPADRLLQTICLEDGMWSVRAWAAYKAVRWFGEKSADPANKVLRRETVVPSDAPNKIQWHWLFDYLPD
ncbi:MAG: DUF1353 domain-containing protein [Nitrospinae bacterium]|nr:DUF1353 domain-containing protein [Nitrospinota bacterium]